jgi:hypothetical protein
MKYQYANLDRKDASELRSIRRQASQVSASVF